MCRNQRPENARNTRKDGNMEFGRPRTIKECAPVGFPLEHDFETSIRAGAIFSSAV
jgi:hypothetical protein